MRESCSGVPLGKDFQNASASRTQPRYQPQCSHSTWCKDWGGVTRQLARHSDVKMTMQYTHIGLEDQAKGIRNLPTDPSWLKTHRPTASASQHISSSLQHICSKSCVCEGQAGTAAGSDCHSTGKKKDNASTDEPTPYGMQRQKKAPPVTDGTLMEAAGHFHFAVSQAALIGSYSLSSQGLRDELRIPAGTLPPFLSDPPSLDYPTHRLRTQTAARCSPKPYFFSSRNQFISSCGKLRSRW